VCQVLHQWNSCCITPFPVLLFHVDGLQLYRYSGIRGAGSLEAAVYEALIEPAAFKLRLPVEPYGSYFPPMHQAAVADAVTPTGMCFVQGVQALLQGVQPNTNSENHC
jgi:hypothetical protein